jgi:hypothetical protein
MKLSKGARETVEKSFSDDFVVYIVNKTPTTIAEAVFASLDVGDWREAVHNEMASILENSTWQVIE